MDSKKFEEFREHVPVAKKCAYFETASTGLISDEIHDRVQHYYEERYLKAGNSTWPYEDGAVPTLEMMDRSRAAIAEMINCDMSDIAFSQSTSQAYCIFVSGLQFEKGDNVVVPKGGYISSRFAWQNMENFGLDVRYAEPRDGALRVPDITALCDERTRAVCVNYVEANTGYKLDIDELGAFCREKGIWLTVDGMQALGVLPVDVKKSKIDFLAGGDYKWMMNYCGCGYAYVSPELRKALKQNAAGWLSDSDRFNIYKERLTLRDDAGRYEIGYPTASGIYGLGIAAARYNKTGRDDIAQYVLSLVKYLRESIAGIEGVELSYDFPERNLSQIISLTIDPKLGICDEDFAAKGVVTALRPPVRDGRPSMRIGLHYYNNRQDIDRLCEVLRGKRE